MVKPNVDLEVTYKKDGVGSIFWVPYEQQLKLRPQLARRARLVPSVRASEARCRSFVSWSRDPAQ